MRIRTRTLGFPFVLALALAVRTAVGGTDVTGHHVLSNGLEVRLHPRSSTPMVATLVLVTTGYALETAANRGYSHLLEHLVFAGTAERSKVDISREVEGIGAYLNGFTRDDYMGYLMVGYRDHLKRQMEILSDILFHATLDEEAVEEAREVVIEEIRRGQSRPETRVHEMFQSILYQGSSYARTGLGNARTVSNVTRQELLGHYRRFYRPDNMVLLAAGGFSEAAILQVLENTFGAAAPGAAPTAVNPPTPLRGRRVFTLRAEIPDVEVQIGFNGPDPREEDAEALDLLAAVLGGSGGRLREALDAKGLKPRSVGAALAVNKGFSRFVVSAAFPADVDPDRVVTGLLEEIATVASQGLTAQQVEDARDALVSAEIMGREKLHYELMAKAPWVLAGSLGRAFSEQRWDAFGPSDLHRVAAEYLAHRPYAALVAIPRATAGKQGGAAGVQREKRVLEGGLTIIAEQRLGSGVFALHVMTRQRSAVEPAGKAGIADFVHRMLTRGSTRRTRAGIEKELRELGASLTTAGNPRVPFGDYYTSRSYSFVRLECLQARAGAALDLLADLIRNVSFPLEEIEKVRGELLDHIAYQDNRPNSLASRLLAEALYGPGPLGRHVLGDETSIRSITRKDLVDFRERYFTAGNLILSVVSGLPPAEAIDLVSSRFSPLPFGAPPVKIHLKMTTEDEVVEQALGKPQGHLTVGAVVAPAEPEIQPALAVVTSIINRRLFEQLREKEGLAYSVGASLRNLDGMGVFTLSMGTAPEKLERARGSVRREIEAVRKGTVSKGELERHVNGITGRLQMRMLSSINRAFYLGLAEKDELPHTFGEDYRRLLLGLTPDDVQRVAETYLPLKVVELIVR